MFTRIVEMTARPGKAMDLALALNNNVLPTLRKQSGFIDEIVMDSNADPEILLEISLWESKTDADRYAHTEFTHVIDGLTDLIHAMPQVRTFNVKQSTIHRISADKAA